MLNPEERKLARLQAMLIFAWLWIAIGVARAGETVDLAMVLAVDCSYSVDDAEFQSELDGLADAFHSEDIKQLVGSGPNGRIAVAVLEWAGAGDEHVAVHWTVLASPASIDAFAERVSHVPRHEIGYTSISGAVRAGIALLSNMPVQPGRRVVDISTDGINNNGVEPELARAEASALGIIVNGLAITREVGYLDLYFQHHVITGPGSFVIKADDNNAYHEAIKQKLLREIAPVS